ncbi:hypothetical protein VTN02DRAFT_3262 [Thermoascus thermophilus]
MQRTGDLDASRREVLGDFFDLPGRWRSRKQRSTAGRTPVSLRLLPAARSCQRVRRARRAGSAARPRRGRQTKRRRPWRAPSSSSSSRRQRQQHATAAVLLVGWHPRQPEETASLGRLRPRVRVRIIYLIINHLRPHPPPSPRRPLADTVRSDFAPISLNPALLDLDRGP